MDFHLLASQQFQQQYPKHKMETSFILAAEQPIWYQETSLNMALNNTEVII